MARGIRELKKEYEGKQEEFNRIAKKVTENYANSFYEYSQEQIAKDFDISTTAVRKLMDYAIEEALVSKNTVIGVARKSIANQQRKHPEAGGTSIRHHKELIKKREKKLVENWPEFVIESIVFEVLHKAQNAESIMKSYNIESERIYRKLLERAVIENICTDEDVDLFVERSYQKGVTLSKIKYFRQAIEKRVAFKNSKNDKSCESDEK